MDWREKYKDKMTTAAEAVSHVKSGEKIIFADWIDHVVGFDFPGSL